MEIKPIVTPDLYMSMSILFMVTVGFRVAMQSLIRARRTRVTLRRVHNAEPAQARGASSGTASEHHTTIPSA